MVVGTTSSLLDVRQWQLGKGQFLPKTDISRANFVAVLGGTLKQELFGAKKCAG